MHAMPCQGKRDWLQFPSIGIHAAGISRVAEKPSPGPEAKVRPQPRGPLREGTRAGARDWMSRAIGGWWEAWPHRGRRRGVHAAGISRVAEKPSPGPEAKVRPQPRGPLREGTRAGARDWMSRAIGGWWEAWPHRGGRKGVHAAGISRVAEKPSPGPEAKVRPQPSCWATWTRRLRPRPWPSRRKPSFPEARMRWKGLPRTLTS